MAMQTVGHVTFDVKYDKTDALVLAAQAIVALEKQVALAKSDLHKELTARQSKVSDVLTSLIVTI